MSMLVGPTEAGKTWFALSLAYCVSQARSIFPGAKGSNNDRPFPVFYVDTESSPKDFNERFNIIKSIYGAAENDLFSFKLLRGEESSIHIAEKETQDKIESWIAEHIQKHSSGDCAFFVVLDTLTGAMGKGENLGTWKSTRKWLQQINACGGSVLLVHHVKNDGETAGIGEKDYTVDVMKMRLHIRSSAGDTQPLNRLYCVTGPSSEPLSPLPPWSWFWRCS